MGSLGPLAMLLGELAGRGLGLNWVPGTSVASGRIARIVSPGHGVQLGAVWYGLKGVSGQRAKCHTGSLVPMWPLGKLQSPGPKYGRALRREGGQMTVPYHGFPVPVWPWGERSELNTKPRPW